MRLLPQQRHVQVAAAAPLALRGALQPRGHAHECALPVGEGPDHAGAPAYLPVQALDGVVGPDPPPVLAGRPSVRQCLGVAIHDDLGGLARLHGADGLEHGRGLRAPRLRYLRQHIPVKADRETPAGGHERNSRQRPEDSVKPSSAPITSRHPSSFTPMATITATFS